MVKTISSPRRAHALRRPLAGALGALLLAAFAAGPASAAPGAGDGAAPPAPVKQVAPDLEADSRPNTPAPVRAGSAQPGPAGAVTPGQGGAVTPPVGRGQLPKAVPNQVIVRFKSHDAFRNDTAYLTSGRVLDENPDLNSRLMYVPDVGAARTALLRNPNVLAVEENGVATAQFNPNDPLSPNQWHLSDWNSGRGSNLRNAWDLTAGYNGARIVIVDTGVDYNHPDLVGKNPLGFNFASNNNDWFDCNGHGTAVAGVSAASTNNRVGVAGADMWAQIYVARITASGDCSGTASFFSMAKAISQTSGWAGTQVINVSFAGYTYSSELDAAVQTARSRGVVVVAAAGNDNTSAPAYPASIVGVLGVGATDQNGNRASFSNFGSPSVDVSAPGVGIVTTRTSAQGGGYVSMNGTSFASPLVAGIALLVRSRYPNASEGTIRAWIQEASFNPQCGWNCYTNAYGFGVVNAYFAAR